MSQLPLNYDCFWTNASSMGCAWGFESDDDEVVRQKFCFPQLPIMILLTPTKGSYSYFVKLPLKRERYHFFSTECNLFKVLTKYLTGNCLLSLRWPLSWLFWVTGLTGVFAYMDWTQAFSLWSWSCSHSHLGSSICQRSLLTHHLTGSELLVFQVVNPEENPSVKVLSTPGLRDGVFSSQYSITANRGCSWLSLHQRATSGRLGRHETKL